MTVYYLPPIMAGALMPPLADGDTVEIDRAWDATEAALAAFRVRLPLGTTTIKVVDEASVGAVWIGADA